jgi:hypothetical protein
MTLFQKKTTESRIILNKVKQKCYTFVRENELVYKDISLAFIFPRKHSFQYSQKGKAIKRRFKELYVYTQK